MVGDKPLDTIPKFLRRNFEKWGDGKVAMRVKEFGQWTTYTWKDYWEKVKYLSLGLTSLGLKAGDKVCILGENKPEWFWAEIAVHVSKATVVGVYTDCVASEVKHYVTDSDTKFVICHDQEQIDKILSIKEECPMIQKVIYWDSKGLWSYDDPILIYFYDVLQLGKEYEQSHPGIFEEKVEDTNGDDVALIMYTSGTTGLPKGLIETQRNIVQGFGMLYLMDSYSEDWEYCSFIAPAWALEQMFAVGCSLFSGMKVNFPEEPETVQENIREIAPTVIFYGVKLWEAIVGTIQAKISDTSALRRLLYKLAIPIGYKFVDLSLDNKQPSLFWRILNRLAHVAVFRAIKDKVGLIKIKVAWVGGGAISPDILRYFQAIGINIKQMYGMNELCGILTCHRHGDIRVDTCGPVVPMGEIRITDDGQILGKNPYQTNGYYKNPEATQKMFEGGWVHTGDFGHITEEDGHLVAIDRIEDMRKLCSGEGFSPQYIEVRLRFSPFINDAIAVGGEDKDFVSSVVVIDMENVSRWAEARNIPYTTFSDLSQKQEVTELVAGEIEKINRRLPTGARIRKFVNLPKPLDPDEAEITRSRKIRRDFIERRYSRLIEALYGDDAEIIEETPIVYRDGRKGVTRTKVHIHSLK
jgi:long-chain acyl-CoA synthetase